MSIGSITSTGKQNEAKKVFLVRGNCQFRYSTDGYITVDVYFYAAATSSNDLSSTAKIGSYIWTNGSYFRDGTLVHRRVPCFGGGRTSDGAYIKAEYIEMYASYSQPTVHGVSTATSPSYPTPSGVFNIEQVNAM